MANKLIIKMCMVSAILGVLVGLVSDLFIRCLQFSTKFIWQTLLPNAQTKPVEVIGITLVGGLLMGICVKYFGVNNGIGFEAVAAAAKRDGALGVKQLKRVVVNTFVGLISGASIGPEAPLITLGGFTGDWLARRLKVTQTQVMGFIAIALGGSLGVLFNSPIAGPVMYAEQPPTKDKTNNTLLVFTSMIAASIGYAIYVWLKAPFLSNLRLIPAYNGFHAIDLVYGLCIGVIGTAIGLALKTSIIKLKQFWQSYDDRPIIRGIIVGLIIGILGAIYPLVLFDGSAQLSQIVASASTYSILTLLALAIVRFISTSVALSGGYQGGNIFPSIFICGTVGLSLHALLPFIPASVAMIACMVPTMYVFIPLPLLSIFLFTELSSFSLIPVMSMSLVSAYIFMNVKGKSKPS